MYTKIILYFKEYRKGNTESIERETCGKDFHPVISGTKQNYVIELNPDGLVKSVPKFEHMFDFLPTKKKRTAVKQWKEFKKEIGKTIFEVTGKGAIVGDTHRI